ncbi:MAG: thiolase family protein [Endozoicomonadaceae bacterium]|nr:thiolase family protein [Endozoicomonadaceae bacterium]MBE8233691.1 thiolase family protein [Endozoicomonadaceae bacterium]
MNQDIVIVAGSRTPIGRFNGALKSVSATDLGSHVIQHIMRRSALDKQLIHEVIMGCVLPAGLRQAPARQAAQKAQLSDHTLCTTVNKVCGSGMQAVILGHDAIQANPTKHIIAGGFESMSQAPYILPRHIEHTLGSRQLQDHLMIDGLENAYTHESMGCIAQKTADQYHITRTQMDEFAITSLQRARTAIEKNYFLEEIDAIDIQNKKTQQCIQQDEHPFHVNIDKIPHLKGVFGGSQSITAANASAISDGASAVLLMTYQEAVALKLKPLARILGHASHAQHPREFTLAPIQAMDTLFKQLNWPLDSIDLFEINEAFAVVTLLAMQHYAIPHEKVNIHGGACALGHPIGSTGCRILLTLIYALQKIGGKRGVASLCIGGGEATAIGLELLS